MTFTHVALIGLMGSGKTSVGRLLADALGLPLVDVDDEIQRQTGKSVRDLWEEGGEDAYRPLERAVVLAALAPGPGRVLAAPGGVAVDPLAADALLQDHVAVVYLRAQPSTLADRIRAQGQERPLLGADPEAALAEQLAARDLRYRDLADRVEDIDAVRAEVVAARILAAFDDALGVEG